MTDRPVPRSPRLTDPAMQRVLAGLAFLLLSWPLLQIAGDRGTLALFVYLFLVWIGLVAVLLMLARSLRRTEQPTENPLP